MTSAGASAVRRGFLKTERKDNWWASPVVVFLGLSAFLVYANVRVFQNAHFEFGGYLTPFYSPLLWGDSVHSWFGSKPDWIPGWISPAMLILVFPAGFRFTCYYYRGAYYKAFWGDPPACAVGELRNEYRGENSLPLIVQNIHRYFLYFAIAFLFLLAHDAWKGMWFADGDGGEEFGIGVGTIVLTLNVIFLSGYTLGCHSLRHLVGGFLDVFSTSPARKKAWDCVTCLNERHMKFAWISLIWVMFTDLYVLMLSRGTWTDWRIL